MLRIVALGDICCTNQNGSWANEARTGPSRGRGLNGRHIEPVIAGLQGHDLLGQRGHGRRGEERHERQLDLEHLPHAQG